MTEILAGSPIELVETGLPGESFGDTARRIGNIGGYPVPPNATDDQVLGAFSAGAVAAVAPSLQMASIAAISAGADADRAELARDAAFNNGDLYETIPEGLAATPEGKRFSVEGAEGSGIYATSYRKEGGVEVDGREYPSKGAYDEVRADTDVVRLQSNAVEHRGNVLNGKRGLSLAKVGVVMERDPSKSHMAGAVEGPCVIEGPDLVYHALATGYTHANRGPGTETAEHHANGLSKIAVASHCHFTSRDLVNWVADPNPFFEGSGIPGAPDEKGVTGAYLRQLADGSWVLRYIGLTAVGYEGGTPRLCWAKAPPIFNRIPLPHEWERMGVWINRGTDGTASAWRYAAIWHPSTIQLDGKFYHYFNASGRASDNSVHEHIGFATSDTEDGAVTIRDDLSPIIEIEPGEDIIGDPSVWRDGNLVLMAYYVAGGGTAYECFAYATVEEAKLGIFHKYADGAPILSPTAGQRDGLYAHKPFIFFLNGEPYHYYTGVSIRSDGVEDRHVALAVQDDAAARKRTLTNGEVLQSLIVPDGGFSIIQEVRSPSGPILRWTYNQPTSEWKVERAGGNGFSAAKLISIGADGIPVLAAAEATVAFQNGWANGANPIRVRLEGRRVFFNGIAAGGTTADATVLFNVPAPFRPAGPEPLILRAGPKLVSAYITAGGDVVLSNGGPIDVAEVSFPGCSFLASD